MSEEKHLKKRFTSLNIYLLVAGVLLVVIGYVLLKFNPDPYDNFVAMNIAPVFLVLGYLVFIPIGLLYKKSVNK